MTLLTKKFSRETEIQADHHGRRLIIELEPPGLLSFREKGRRTKVTASIVWLYRKTLQAEAEKNMRQKQARPRARRGLLHP